VKSNEIIKLKNDRETYRLPAHVEAIIWNSKRSRTDITIVDISAGGLLFASNLQLYLDEEVMLEFTFQEAGFLEMCKVIRVFEDENKTRRYGAKFISVNQSHDMLVKHLHQIQIKQRKTVQPK